MENNFKVSNPKSFDGWDIIEYIKGRRKSAITVIAAILGYFMTNDANVAFVSGLIIEMIVSIGEYYFKKVEY